MADHIAKAVSLIEEQQKKVRERSAPWMVGEQLKDICRGEPRCAELIAQDLENPAMGITAAEKRIKDFADGHKTGSFACVTPIEADRILREFYGLPERAVEAVPRGGEKSGQGRGMNLDLEALWQ